MGLGVAGLAVIGLGGLFIILKMYFVPGDASSKCDMRCLQLVEVLTGFL